MNMKQLVYSYEDRIAAKQVFANQLVDGLNQVLTRFKERANYFSQPITEDFAWQLVSDPVGQFDELVRINSSIKGVAGKPLDIVALAKLLNIDREGWLNDCKILIPGSVNQYARQGTTAVYKLSEAHRPLVSWQEGKFILNEKALAEQLEAYKVYASTPEQIAEVEFWQGVAYTFNCLLTKGVIDRIDANAMQDRIKMLAIVKHGETVKFVPDDAKLAEKIAVMAVN